MIYRMKGCRRDLVLPFALLTAISASGPQIWAQSTQGGVGITVTDPGGAVVPGAKLELRDLASNELQTASSREDGEYRFVNLNVGRYSLTVTKTGFANEVVSPVEVQLARVTDVAVHLKIGSTSETV